MGPEHTRSSGYKYSLAREMNEAGQVRGYSLRYNGGVTSLGRSAWFYDGTSTLNIGLVDPEHTRDDDFKSSIDTDLNESGQVVGHSDRFRGHSPMGHDAWLYDPVLDQTIQFQLSARSDGYALSTVNYLGEDGLVLGSYTLFDNLDNDLGQRAFYFTIEDGLYDLGSLVNGGLAANGWDFLANAIRANGVGRILGTGELTSQSGGQVVYLFTPVPEPSTLLLFYIGTLGVAALRRRH